MNNFIPTDAPPKVSEQIKARLKAEGRRFFANDTIYDLLKPGELEALKVEAQEAIQALLQALVIDVENDHNTKDTARRVAKMYIDEVMMGRFHEPPAITKFPNDKQLDQLFTVGPIKVRSMCSHHMAPIIGNVWVGVVAGSELIGLSKFNRLAHHVMSRPQIQEEAIVQLADALEKAFKPLGLAITMKAEHFCMCWRGVKDDSSMVNTVVRGIIAHNPHAKQEYFDTIKGQGF